MALRLQSLAKDITDDDAADVLIGAAVDRFSGLDILVNNAEAGWRNTFGNHS